MKHPDFTLGFKERIEEARKFYNSRKATFTGPDNKERPAVVIGTIFHEALSGKWQICVHFRMSRLDNHPDALEADWARQYFAVDDERIEWHDDA